MMEQVESDCCSICLESFDSKPKNSNKIFLECGHEFCFTCIIPQMKQKNSCPLCRAPIDKKGGGNENIPEKLSHTAGVGLLDRVMYEHYTRDMIKHDIRDMLEKIKFNMEYNIEINWKDLEFKCANSVLFDMENFGIRLLYTAKVLDRYEDNFDIIEGIEEEEEELHANHRIRERLITENDDNGLEYERDDISDAIRILFED
jgi:hypothetical protein